MKWWVFTEGHVAGPYSADTLGRRPSFTAHSLVCEEPLGGDVRPPWRRADSVPSLRAVLEGRPFPPDPTLEDVADQRRLAERLAELESAARRNAAELKSLGVRETLLRGELARKDMGLRELGRRLSTASSQVAAVHALEDGLRTVLDGLRGHDDAVREMGDQLKSLAAAAVEAVGKADESAAETMRLAADAIAEAKVLADRSLDKASRALEVAETAALNAASEAKALARRSLDAAQKALENAESAARLTAEETKTLAESSIAAAREALEKAETAARLAAARAKETARKKPAEPAADGKRRRRRPGAPPVDLGLPDATPIDPPNF